LSTGLLTDTAANVQAFYQYSAFGEQLLRGSGSFSGPPTADTIYQFAGERFNADSGLYYLRARWMDPRAGRFTSTDPLQGNDRRPLTLNHYVYANADAVNGRDPRGQETLGGMSAAIGMTMNIAMQAQFALSLYGYANGGDEIPVPPFLWGAVFLMEAAGAASEIMLSPAELAGVAATSGGNHKHHIIPEYLCGHAKQRLVSVPAHEHAILHTAMDKFGPVLEKLGRRAIAKLMPARAANLEKRLTVRAIGKNPLGRSAIVAGLAGFYTLFDMWDVGVLDRAGNPGGWPTIGIGFWPEANRFVDGFSSCR